MRKAIVEIEPYEATKVAQGPLFKFIRSYEVLEVLKQDKQLGLYVDIIECHLKEGVSIDGLDRIGNMEILSVIRSEGDRHTCLVRGQQSEGEREDFEGAGLDLIYTTPSLISEDRLVVSFISSDRDLRRFVEMVRAHIGKVIGITVKRATYQRSEILSILTGKQREVLLAAYRNGYYDIPRRIGSGKLSEIVGVSRPTLLEHLRKGERRILVEVLEGQSDQLTPPR